MKKFFNQRGYSLTEVLLALTVTAILVVAVSNFSKVSFGAYESTSNSLKEIQQARLAMDKIFEDLRVASKISVTANSITYEVLNDSNTDVVTHILFMGDDGRLYINNGSTDKAITRDVVKSLTCSLDSDDIDGNTVNITVQLSDATLLSTTIHPLNL